MYCDFGNQAELYGNNIGLDAKSAMLVPNSQMHDIILGSQVAFINSGRYISRAWWLKGVKLCLYWRSTSVALPYVRAACPDPMDYCTLRQPLYTVTAVTNVLNASSHQLELPKHMLTLWYLRTDVTLLAIPLPMLLTLQIQFNQGHLGSHVLLCHLDHDLHLFACLLLPR